jgi:hypothetical protein
MTTEREQEDTRMSDPPSDHDSDGDVGTPRWVKALGISAIVIVLLFVILHLAFGGFGSHSSR